MYGVRKAQATIFIILGIALIVGVTFTVLTVSRSQDQTISQQTSAQLSTYLTPVESFVTECLRTTAKRALQRAGEQGGYTNLERNLQNVNYANPLESDVVTIMQGATEFAIPYYWHMTSRTGCINNCDFSFSFPELNRDSPMPSIERELEMFIKEEILHCINDFEDFNYPITVLDDPYVETIVALEGDTISFSLYYPLEMEVDGDVLRTDWYYTEHNLDLRRIYELALEISMFQGTYRFLERHALNIIGTYGGLNNPIPPFGETTFDFGSPGNMWVKSSVQNEVKNALVKYVPLLRATNTRNYVDYGETAIERKILDDLMRIELVNLYHDFDVTFSYLPWWPLYFDMNCNGELCQAESFSNTFLLLIGIQNYNFLYTLSYPVLVQIHDPFAFDGEGYSYYFALEANIAHNDAIRPNEIGFMEESILASETFLCEQLYSGEYTFTVINSITQQPVPEASIFFNAGDETCPIGLTDEQGQANITLPLAFSARLDIVKDGYQTISEPIITRENVGMDVGRIEIEPFRNRNITIKKMTLTKLSADGEWMRTGSFDDLAEGQEAIVMLTKTTGTGDGIMEVVSLSGSNRQEEISVVPGEYEVQVMLFDRNEIVIPERTEEVGSWPFEQTVRYPEITFNNESPWMLGGLEENFIMTDMIDYHTTIELRVIALDLGAVSENNRRIEDMEVLGKVEEYTEMHISELGFRYR